MFIIVNAN